MNTEPVASSDGKALAHVERVVFLQSLDLLRWCRAEQILRLAGIAEERRYEAAQTLFERDQDAGGIHCVVRGRVELEPGGEGLGAMETLGVVEVLTERRHRVTARALEPTVTLFLGRDDFFDLLSHNIEIVRALFRQLVDPRSQGEGE